MFSVEAGEGRDLKSKGGRSDTKHFPFQLSTQHSDFNILTLRVPVELRTGPAPHWSSCASFRESVHGRY